VKKRIKLTGPMLKPEQIAKTQKLTQAQQKKIKKQLKGLK
jgi:hypothetical protein